MYNIKRIDGKYLAIHDKNKSEIYWIPDDVFTKLVRNGISRKNISDMVFLDAVQTYSGISPYDCFDNLEQDGLCNAKKIVITSDENLKKLRAKKAIGKEIKTNVKKSKSIKEVKTRVVSGTLAIIMAFTGGAALVKKMKDKNKETTIIEKNIDKDVRKSNVDKRYEKDDVLDFYYDSYDVSEESAKNSMKFLDLCKKYGKMYGEDYRLLMGTLAQELNGEDKLELDTPAIGPAQLEKKVWLNTYVVAYNEEKKEYEKKWLIGPNAEDTIDDDEFKKRPKSDDIIAKYGKDNVINIETAEGSIWARAMIDSYNREQAYKNGALDSIPNNDFQAYVKARENKGPIVYKTLEYGDNWKEHLDITNNGDDDYYKKIYAYADIISDYCQDYSPYVTRVYDGKEMILFAVNAVQSNTMAKTK